LSQGANFGKSDSFRASAHACCAITSVRDISSTSDAGIFVPRSYPRRHSRTFAPASLCGSRTSSDCSTAPIHSPIFGPVARSCTIRAISDDWFARFSAPPGGMYVCSSQPSNEPIDASVEISRISRTSWS
jgi:hypothetical protein